MYTALFITTRPSISEPFVSETPQFLSLSAKLANAAESWPGFVGIEDTISEDKLTLTRSVQWNSSLERRNYLKANKPMFNQLNSASKQFFAKNPAHIFWTFP